LKLGNAGITSEMKAAFTRVKSSHACLKEVGFQGFFSARFFAKIVFPSAILDIARVVPRPLPDYRRWYLTMNNNGPIKNYLYTCDYHMTVFNLKSQSCLL
jgi:hypothetical protein